MAYLYTSQPRLVTLARLQSIKNWHVSHKDDHPLEYQLWDVTLTLWLMGLIAWLPAYALDATWAYPLCIIGAFMPRMYLQLRKYAHDAGRVRCDWVHLLA